MTTLKSNFQTFFTRKTRGLLQLAALSALVPLSAFAQTPVNLNSAGNFTILSKTGITTVATSDITGNIGVSPIAATAMTGFGLILNTEGTLSTSPQVSGSVYAASYNAPTPALLSAAIGDMNTAYNDAIGRAPDFVELHGGDLSGKTLVPGVYVWSTNVLINGDLTLHGDGTAVWILQVAQNVTQAAAVRVVLTGGAKAANVVWVTGGTVTVGAGGHTEGVILAGTSISFGAGASVLGRLLANTEVVLIQNVVTQPATGTASEPRTDMSGFSLSQNYPNPFNPSTSIQFEVPVGGFVTLQVSDLLGRQVAVLVSEKRAAGAHTVSWDASAFTSGLYLLRLEMNGVSLTRKMTLAK